MSERLRILALTTRRKISRRTVRRLRTKLQLGNDVQLELVTVFTPAQRLNVHRVDTFDLSLIPYRPAIPVSGEGLASWGGPRKLIARGLRAARKVGHWVRRRPPRVEPARALEVACATSFSLLHRAQTADVVLAVDDRAVPGAARLARRAPRPVVVRGAIHVRRTLELRGYALPPIPGLPLEVTANPQPAKTKSIALPPAPEPAPFRVLIAPANYAGQAAAWAKALRSHVPHATAMNAQVGIHPKFPFPTDYEIEHAATPVPIDVSRVRLERSRRFGDVWLGHTLWQALQLDGFCQSHLREGRECVPWATMAEILVVARLCEPSSELHIAEDWYRRCALEDILGVPAAQVNDDRLYRALDQLLPHQEALQVHLKQRLGELFELDYELLLYDVTSTYFEGQAKRNPMALRGHSRDHRPDCPNID